MATAGEQPGSSRLSYNVIAGQSLDRLAALSDGIFAVVMTLLVLDLHAPVRDEIHAQAELWDALADLWPSFVAYLMSFLTLGIFWIGQQTQINHFTRSDRNLTWINLGFLLTISLMPFSTALLAEFMTYRLAVVVYWLNLVLPGIALLASWRYARRAEILVPEATAEVCAATERRIVIAQALYAVAVALCLIHPYVSVAALVLLQLDSVVAPRFGLLRRF